MKSLFFTLIFALTASFQKEKINPNGHDSIIETEEYTDQTVGQNDRYSDDSLRQSYDSVIPITLDLFRPHDNSPKVHHVTVRNGESLVSGWKHDHTTNTLLLPNDLTTHERNMTIYIEHKGTITSRDFFLQYPSSSAVTAADNKGKK